MASVWMANPSTSSSPFCCLPPSSLLQSGGSFSSLSSSCFFAHTPVSGKLESAGGGIRVGKKCSNLKTMCSTTVGQATKQKDALKERSVSVILLAGGKGKRMGASMPKQYLPLLNQPIALYSFYTFSQMIEVGEIVVVCDPSYKDIFEDTKEKPNVHIKFALPGKERQDSVYNGLQVVDSRSELVCVHDSARPLVSAGDVAKLMLEEIFPSRPLAKQAEMVRLKLERIKINMIGCRSLVCLQAINYSFIYILKFAIDSEQVLKDGWIHGAAVLGVPAKATIKEASSDSFVVRTLDRKTLWEMQTPQVIKPDLLKRGFELVNREGLEVTDDVSIVEHLKHPVYITEGSYTNLKVTTPDDLLLAERILSSSS